MGHYLDMVDNAKADPKAGTEPNENFARELLQLFSIGVVELKPDGTPVLDAARRSRSRATGRPRSRRSRACSPAGRIRPTTRRSRRGPTTAAISRSRWCRCRSDHDTRRQGAAQGRDGARGTGAADADLRVAVRNVFMHPNVGPFFAQAPDPPTGHGQPVAGLRRARRGGLQQQRQRRARRHEGRAARGAARRGGARRREDRRELRHAEGAGAVRHVGAAPAGRAQRRQRTSYEPARAMGQDVFYSPTVFNYYPAEFRIPGTALVAPQFGIHNTNTVLHRDELRLRDDLQRRLRAPMARCRTRSARRSTSRRSRGAAGDPVKLVALINERLFGGGMPLRHARRSSTRSPRCLRTIPTSARARRCSSRRRRSSTR